MNEVYYVQHGLYVTMIKSDSGGGSITMVHHDRFNTAAVHCLSILPQVTYKNDFNVTINMN